MAQRLHSLNTKTSRDTSVNCDAYLTKLMKKGFEMPIHARVKTTSPSRCNHMNPQPCKRMLRNASAPVARKPNTRDFIPVRESIRETSATRRPGIIMETHTSSSRFKSRHRSMSPPSSHKESWDRLLNHAPHTSRKPKTIGSFSSFDPLRTLHFLGSELKNKLRHKLPNDEQIQQMVTSMQQALIRIPKDIENLEENLTNQRSRKSRIDLKTSTTTLPQKLKYHVASQTPIELVPDIESLQKQLESSTAKLEASCKQMEDLSGQLTNEKEELQLLLRAEKETARSLRKQIEELEASRCQETGKLVTDYQKEIDALHETVESLKSKNENQELNFVKSLEGLRGVLLQTKKERLMFENNCKIITHQHTLACLEKEKLAAILAVRERQLNEIRCEMDLLQEVVNNELSELKEPFPDFLLNIPPHHKPHSPNKSPNPPKEGLGFNGCNFDAPGDADGAVLKEDGDKNLTISSIDSERQEMEHIFGNLANLRNAVSINSSDTSACLQEIQRNGLLENFSRETSVKEEEESEGQSGNNFGKVSAIDDEKNVPIKEDDSEIVPVRLPKDLDASSELKIANFQKKIAEIEREIMITFADAIAPL